MSNARLFPAGRFGAAVLAAAWICCVQFALGQGPGWNIAPSGLIPILGTEPNASAALPAAHQQPMHPSRRGPLARLVENPDQTDGAPPFALTDQTGTIQRYVEPVPGIDLATYIGQVVVVRHDTGGTLLASQLELPPQPLVPMVTNSGDDRYSPGASRLASSHHTSGSSGMVEQAQYVDSDDSSVQLLPDDLPISGGGAMAPGRLMPLEGMGPGGEEPIYADQMGPGMEGPAFGPPDGSMQYGPNGMMPYPNQMMGPCPNCGPSQNGMSYGADGGNAAACNEKQPGRARLSADIELSLLRPQIAENAIGKLSENYQFSPRIILGLRDVGNLDGRVRYWHYDRNTELLGSDDDVKIRFDVLDVEALHRFAGRRSEMTLAAGVRLAGIHLTDIADLKSDADLIGITLAGDGLTPLGLFPGGHLGLVYGGRLSILGGDWGGDFSQFVLGQVHNDNVLVHELYGGVELARRFRALNVHARLVFETQNWKSDVLAEGADIESIGFFGPGLQLGAEF